MSGASCARMGGDRTNSSGQMRMNEFLCLLDYRSLHEACSATCRRRYHLESPNTTAGLRCLSDPGQDRSKLGFSREPLVSVSLTLAKGSRLNMQSLRCKNPNGSG